MAVTELTGRRSRQTRTGELRLFLKYCRNERVLQIHNGHTLYDGRALKNLRSAESQATTSAEIAPEQPGSQLEFLPPLPLQDQRGSFVAHPRLSQPTASNQISRVAEVEAATVLSPLLFPLLFPVSKMLMTPKINAIRLDLFSDFLMLSLVYGLGVW